MAQGSGRDRVRAAGRAIRHFIGYHRVVLSILGGVILYAFAAPTGVTILAGIPAVIAGLGLRVWSSGSISKNQALAQEGPYAIVRHPLYLGNLLIAFGFVTMGGRLELFLPLLAILGLIYYSTIAEEERFLRDRFGQEFEAYASKVAGLFPRLGNFAASRGQFEWGRVMSHREYNAWAAVSACLVLMVVKSIYFG